MYLMKGIRTMSNKEYIPPIMTFVEVNLSLVVCEESSNSDLFDGPVLNALQIPSKQSEPAGRSTEPDLQR